jgi:hypothetical protein
LIKRTPALRLALAAVAVAAFLVVPTALAAKGAKPGTGGGGSTSGSSLSLVLMDGATEPRLGGRITFAVTTTATDSPFVGVRCWQGTNWVYDAYVGLFDGAMFNPWLTLGSTNWVAGVEASCTARLFYYDNRGRQKVLATTDFLVAA